METFISGFSVVLQPHYLMFMLAGVTFGLVLGFLPGMNGGMGIALMLPFTYAMDPLTALVLLMSIYSGSLFGGTVTAIMINIPGTPGSLCAVLDGYPMTLKGESNRAMGLALARSVTGGLLGSLCLLLICEPLANFALRFGPAEMFMVVVFGLSVVGSLSDDIVKSLFAGAAGVLLGTVGISTTGAIRGAMGSVYLMDGFPLVPALIGLVALPELYNQIKQRKQYVAEYSAKEKAIVGIVKGVAEGFRHILRMIWCAALGIIVGIMPAAGASVAALLAYNQSKNFSRHPEKYGTGIPEGVVSCETADNASEGGALATMFVLGIPGSTATAIMLGGLIIQGWTPGPRLFLDNQDIIYTAFSSLFVQQIVMVLLGTVLCCLGARLIRIPVRYLVPCIMVFAIVGAFASRNAIFDAGLMIMFSALGFLMKKNNFPIVPVILGILLGPIADAELLRVLQAYDNFWQIFAEPIVVVLFVISLACILLPVIMKKRRQKQGVEPQ